MGFHFQTFSNLMPNLNSIMENVRCMREYLLSDDHDLNRWHQHAAGQGRRIRPYLILRDLEHDFRQFLLSASVLQHTGLQRSATSGCQEWINAPEAAVRYSYVITRHAICFVCTLSEECGDDVCDETFCD